jgi:hypothetical protein
MEKNRKTQIIISCITVGVVIVVVGIILFFYLQKGKGQEQAENVTSEEETTLSATTAQLDETETTIQETTTEVVYNASAAKVFSTTAGAQWDTFYEDSVFVGDSVMYGFERYITGKPGTLSDPLFLTFGSYAARIEMDYTTAEYQKYLPSYQGNQMHIKDSLPLTGKKKVFLFFGLNDLGMAE